MAKIVARRAPATTRYFIVATIRIQAILAQLAVGIPHAQLQAHRGSSGCSSNGAKEVETASLRDQLRDPSSRNEQMRISRMSRVRGSMGDATNECVATC